MSLIRSSLMGSGIVALSAASLFAQHGGYGAARAPLPSSTALGAGALTTGPSSTAASTMPSFGFTRPNTTYSGRSGYYGGGSVHSGGGNGNRGGYRGGGSYGNKGYDNYRHLPQAYIFAPYYYPFFDSGAGGATWPSPVLPPDENADLGPDPGAEAMMAGQAALGQQVQRLTDQVNNLMYNQQAQANPPAPPPPAIPITIVLRSGERLQVENYAVSGSTFWNFTDHGTRRIALSSIDLQASAKATEEAGGDFPQIQAAKP